MPPELVTAESVGKNFNILLYGEAGTGKTYLAGTAQDHQDFKDVLFLDIEGGLITVANKGVYREKIKSVEQLEQVFYSCLQKAKGYEKIKTVVIDNASELQVLNMESILKKRNGSDFEYWQADYGKSTKQLQKLFRELRDSPLNVIFIAHPKFVYPKGQEDAAPIGIIPSLTQVLAKSLMGYVDFVWYLYIDERTVIDPETKKKKIVATRKIVTRDKGIVKAKTRGIEFSKALGEEFSNPTIPKLYDLFLKTEGVKQ